jgi:iron(III) transport system substrate-binding protein
MATDRRTVMGAGAALLALPSLLKAQSGEAALYEAAKREGEMTWYIAHYSSETAERIARAFSTKYPGVKVNVVRTTAQVAYQRLNQDLQAKTPNCDLFGSTDIGHYVALKQKNLFMPYAPQGVSQIDSRFVGFDPDNTFHVTTATFISVVYNTQKVSADRVPKSWRDLADPKWQGQLSLGHPGFSGFVGTWVVQMKKMYGWEYFEKLAKNKPQIGRSIIDTITTVTSGERLVAAGPGALALLGAGRGNPIGVSYPEEGVVLMASPSAVMANARHPNAAKLFLEFMYSPEVAAIGVDEFGTPLRRDSKPRPGVVPIGEMKTLRPSVKEIVEGIPQVTEQWRDLFGV